jgi:hypothetical protein
VILCAHCGESLCPLLRTPRVTPISAQGVTPLFPTHNTARAVSKSVQVAIRSAMWETVHMPKDRKKTYSDHQSEASRAKNQPNQKKSAREETGQAPAQIVKQAAKKI